VTTRLFTTLPLKKLMSEATFNFLVDTLVEEVRMHPYYDELLQLIELQLQDDAECCMSNAYSA
jgi:hypothetical protein